MTLFIALLLASGPSAVSQGAPKIRWMTYRSDALHARITVPAAWVANKSAQALAFHSPGDLEIRVGVGLMRSAYEGTIEDAADALAATEGLEGWSRRFRQVAGLRAMEVVGHPKDNPKMKMARYFIATPSGPYLLQCVAPEKAWPLYRHIFEAIINSLRFV